MCWVRALSLSYIPSPRILFCIWVLSVEFSVKLWHPEHALHVCFIIFVLYGYQQKEFMNCLTNKKNQQITSEAKNPGGDHCSTSNEREGCFVQ